MAALDQITGQVIDGKYRINKQLGQGGMGAVYKATHLGTKRSVALKVIVPKFMNNVEFVERFKREAEAAGRLRHPNVVNVTDFGFAEVGSIHLAYLVMEYLDGLSLGNLLEKRGPLPLEFVVDIVEQVCLAIEKAHQRGIIHRDLKPDNIWLEPNGRGGYNVKVLDFGLAKLHEDAPITSGEMALKRSTAPTLATSLKDSASHTLGPNEREMNDTLPFGSMPEADDSEATMQLTAGGSAAQTLRKEKRESPATQQKTEETSDGRITKAGTILGTPLYMSPEQCTGDELDARSDIYSLGVIVYQMLTGTTPFTGELFSLIVKHVDKEPPPINKKRRDIPKSVASLVMSTLAKKPDDRPKSAAAFATALRANAEGEIPILDKASDFHRKRRSTLLLISLSIYAPFILFSFLLLYAHLWFLLLIFPLILFANDLDIAACTYIYECWRLSPSEPIKVLSVLAALIRKSGAIALTAARGSLSVLLRLPKLIAPGVRTSIDYSLYASVVMIEEKQGKEALDRSSRLSGQLRYLSSAIKLYDLLIGLLIAVTLLCSFLLIYKLNLLSTLREGGFPILTVIFFCASLLLPMIIGIRHSTCAIASAIIYLKARLASGELTDSIFGEDFEQSERSRGSRESYRKTASNLAMFVVKHVVVLPILWLTLVASVALKDFYYSSNIVTAAAEGHTDLIKEMLNQGDDVNSKNSAGFTALIIAAQSGYPDTIKALLEAHADVNARTMEGETALYYAALLGRYEVVKELISAGADVNISSFGGRTPLIVASYGRFPGSVEIARALLAAGADPNQRENHGRTALSYAEESERSDIIELLKAAGAKD